jgi:hypothetical protein
VANYQNLKIKETKIVFISACYSYSIGVLFKRLGVPIVIAINATSMVLDEAATLFA